MELPELYRRMARSRTFEIAVEGLWKAGLISGEMHLGTGEEAIAVGVACHLRQGDGLSLTHRCTPALVARGVPLVSMLREMLGRRDGLCGGCGGHMHLMSRPHLAAASGIVGASLPLGAGFALAAKRLRRGSVAVAFIGSGALNQGMALETLNLARVWELPLAVVCIDNGWAITTTSGSLTAGALVDRARAFGWTTEGVDGVDVEATFRIAGQLIERLRRGRGPSFLYATCPRIDGHYLGDPLLAQSRDPVGEDGKQTLGRVVASATAKGGAGWLDRAGSMARLAATMAKARGTPRRDGKGDPLRLARAKMDREAREHIDREVAREVDEAVETVLAEGAGDA